MSSQMLGALALGAWLAWEPAAALADNVRGVDKASAEKIAQQLTPGQVLIWNCPTCRGVQVMRVEQIRVSKLGNSADFGVMLKRDVLISSRKTFETLAAMRCADPTRLYPDEDAEGWPVDLTYTYVKRDAAGAWVSIGRFVGVVNNPVPTITLTKEALANIERCAAKHRRSPNAMDDASDPLAERLVSRDGRLRAAALEELRKTINRMSRVEQGRLAAALIEETGDVGTVEEGPGNSKRAQDALRQAGPVAARYLIRTVSDTSEDVVIRDIAARVLGRIRPAPKESIPALVALLKTEYRSPPRGGVAFALGELGSGDPPVIQALREALAYRYPDIPGGIDLNSFSEITLALKKLGVEAPDAVPVLLRSLEDPNPYQRVAAALTLLQLDPGMTKPVEVLSDVLKDRRLDQVHDYLLLTVQDVGPAAKAVVPALIEFLGKTDRYVDREKVIEALERIGTPEAREAVKRQR